MNHVRKLQRIEAAVGSNVLVPGVLGGSPSIFQAQGSVVCCFGAPETPHPLLAKHPSPLNYFRLESQSYPGINLQIALNTCTAMSTMQAPHFGAIVGRRQELDIPNVGF